VGSATSHTIPRISGPELEEARHRRVQGSLLYIGQHNLAARFGKSTAQRQPNATRATSHKGSFPNKLPDHFALPRIGILNGDATSCFAENP
jgi:hypothetical protein